AALTCRVAVSVVLVAPASVPVTVWSVATVEVQVWVTSSQLEAAVGLMVNKVLAVGSPLVLRWLGRPVGRWDGGAWGVWAGGGGVGAGVGAEGGVVRCRGRGVQGGRVGGVGCARGGGGGGVVGWHR